MERKSNKNQKQKNYFLLIVLLGIIALVYFATVIKLSNNKQHWALSNLSSHNDKEKASS